jgi:hypothetical protein
LCQWSQDKGHKNGTMWMFPAFLDLNMMIFTLSFPCPIKLHSLAQKIPLVHVSILNASPQFELHEHFTQYHPLEHTVTKHGHWVLSCTPRILVST